MSAIQHETLFRCDWGRYRLVIGPRLTLAHLEERNAESQLIDTRHLMRQVVHKPGASAALRRCCADWGLTTLALWQIDDGALADWLAAQMKRGSLGIARVPDLACWIRDIENLDLKPPRDRGALWTKTGEDVARALAKQDGRVTLEMLLDESGFRSRYDAEFGKSQTEVTRQIWEAISRRYAQSLEGKVVAYVDDAELFQSITQDVPRGKAEPQFTAELDEIASIMERNTKIETVIVKDVLGGPPVTMTRGAVLQAARRSH
jgi:hypothetical protein